MAGAEELNQQEARIALLRRSLEMLEVGKLRLVRAGGVETTAETIEAVRRQIGTLMEATRKLRRETDPVEGREGPEGVTLLARLSLAS